MDCYSVDVWYGSKLLTVFVLSRVDVQCPINAVRNIRCHKDHRYTGIQDSSRKSRSTARWTDVDLSSLSIYVDSYRCDADSPKCCTVAVRNYVGVMDLAWIWDIIGGMPANTQ